MTIAISTRRHLSRPVRTGAEFFLFAAIALTSAGCDEPDADSRQLLAQASWELRGVTAADKPEQLPAASREAVYEKINRTLGPVRSADDETLQQSAKMISAAAMEGLASVHSARATHLQETLLTSISRVRTIADQAQAQLSLAAALESFDPDKELSAQQSLAEEKKAEIVQARNGRHQRQTKIDELREEMAQHQTQRSTLRTQEAEIRSRALSAAGDERAEMIRQATKVQRAADEQAMSVALLEAQIARNEPDLAAFELEIGRLESQLRSLNDSVDEMQARLDAAREQAELSRADAEMVADAYRAGVESIVELLTGEYAAASDAAEAAAEQGANYLRGVRDPDAAVRRAKLLQKLGDIRASRASVEADLERLVKMVIALEPALPGVEGLTGFLEQSGIDGQARRAAAIEAYAAARDQFGSAGLRGEARDRVDKVAQELDQLVQSFGGESAMENDEAGG